MPAQAIRFERVTFRYPGRDEEACSELDLEVSAGRSLAIVGANGAGKTTVMKLLGRLYEPTAGRVTVDGIDLQHVDARAWQRRIAVVVQDLVRYPVAFRDNVGFGALERAGDDRAIARAIETAGAAELVAGLPFGWQTVLSRQFAGGVELSGGQWQRVALARALLAVDAGAGLLLLDEPTAHLDATGEAEVNRVLLRLGHHLDRPLTTVLVSHRFSTVRHADRIVVIDGGRVAEDGSHASLMAAGGRYAEMFTLQATPYEDGARRA
jgi:ATP-binding cassette subfamily B protein